MGFVNAVINDPSVYKWVHGSLEGPLDMTPVMDLPETIVLKWEDEGAFIFHNKSPGTYEVHTQFRKSGNVKIAALAAADFMFTFSPCKVLTTMVPRNNRAARRLAKKVGFTFTHTEGEWPTDDDGLVPLDHFKYTVEEWSSKCQQAR